MIITIIINDNDCNNTIKKMKIIMLNKSSFDDDFNNKFLLFYILFSGDKRPESFVWLFGRKWEHTWGLSVWISSCRNINYFTLFAFTVSNRNVHVRFVSTCNLLISLIWVCNNTHSVQTPASDTVVDRFRSKIFRS